MQASYFHLDISLLENMPLHSYLSLMFVVHARLSEEVNHSKLAYSCLHRSIFADRYKSDIFVICACLILALRRESEDLLYLVWFRLFRCGLLDLLHRLLTIVLDPVKLVNFAVPMTDVAQTSLGQRLTNSFYPLGKVTPLSIVLLLPD